MILNEYETVIASRPDISDDIQTQLLQKLTSIITANGGEVLVEEKMGRIKMAYPIQNHIYANYVLLDYVAPTALPLELERNMNLDDKFIRYITVKLGENITVDACREAAESRSKRRTERNSQE